MSIAGTRDLAWNIEGADELAGVLGLEWSIDQFRPTIGGFQPLSWALGSAGDTISPVLTGAPTGLLGTLTVTIVAYDGTVTVYFPSGSDIAEVPASTGRYVATVPKPDIGKYWIAWAYPGVTIEPVLLTISRDGALEMRSGIGAALGS